MPYARFVLTAFISVWVILFAYVLFLVNKQNKIQRELASLKESLTGKKGN